MIVGIISIKVFGTASCRYFQIKFKEYVQLEIYFVCLHKRWQAYEY